MKPIVFAAVALVLAPSAHALRLNEQGEGQALWFPYYTVNGSHDTYLTINNTSWAGSVAKVRFLDARHGRPVMDFYLYLAPHGSWSAVVYQTSADTAPMLRTSDSSCTTPSIPAQGIRFTTTAFDGSGSLPADDAPHDITRTREGSIEVIAVGHIVPGTPTARAIAAATGSATGCASLPGSVIQDIVAPDNELYGSAAVINVGEGTYSAYNADAIADFTDVPLLTSTTGPLEPSFAQANKTVYYFADGSAASNAGAVRTATLQYGVDAVTALFVSDTISNDFIVSPALGSQTDWIVSYPTRRFYVDPIYANTATGSAGTPAVGTTFHVDTFAPDGSATTTSTGLNVTLPYDNVNVVEITRNGTAAADTVFASKFATGLQVGTDSGVLRLRTAQSGSAGLGLALPGMEMLYGSAVSGFMAYNVVNANAAPGRLANYGAAFRHRSTKCDGPTAYPAACRRWDDGSGSPN